VYLAGPINGCRDSEARDWRAAARQKLNADIRDPMDRDYRGQENAHAASLVEQDKLDIAQSDVVLVWYERPSIGTAMEVLWAWLLRRVVVVVDRSNVPLSPWLTHHANVFVSSLDAAAEWLNGHDADHVQIERIPAA
jgi:hypothetical protein